MLIKNILFSMPRNIISSVFFTGIRNALIAATLLSVSLSANSEGWDEMDLFVGAGIGLSDLSPQHVKDQGFSIDDNWQTAWKITGGLDVNDYISVEGYYSNLGSTGLSPSADIGYRMYGADVILHYWAKGEERAPGSIALYAKAGLNDTDTYSTGDVGENGNVRKIFGGLGAEIYLPHKFSVRFEFESYNADASFFSLNLVKRFGFKSKKIEQKEFVAMEETLPGTASVPSTVVLAPVVLDSDLDGLLDNDDQCPYTAKGMSIDNVGCATSIDEMSDSNDEMSDSNDEMSDSNGEMSDSNGEINGLNSEMSDLIANLKFETHSSLLTKSSEIDLNKIAGLLVNYPDVKIEVQVHSEDSGSSDYNKMLSQMRADSVVRYLKSKNIARSRLDAIGFGEEQPIADNNTSAGRAKNRRVEFVIKKP